MNARILVIFTLVVSGLLPTIPVNAEVTGAHISKIITDYIEPGHASVSILVCAGNSTLSNPEILVSSEKESKSLVLQRVIPANTCVGETAKIQTNNLSSLTATLSSTKGPIMLDNITRDDGVVMIEGLSVDGKIFVKTSSTIPVQGEPSTIKVEFFDVFRKPVKSVNYDILVMQDNNIVLDKKKSYSQFGVNFHETDSLMSSSPLDIKIKLLGFGISGMENEWIGSNGDIITFTTVPEFGTITAMVLVTAIITVIAVSARSRLSIISRF